MAFVDVGPANAALTAVFLHGNPTSSFLWRHVIPPVRDAGVRCCAPDLIGMGNSSKIPACQYTFADHAKHLDEWFRVMAFRNPIILVIHDWGSALGFDWARRHPNKVAGIVYMEAVFPFAGWTDWPEKSVGIFQAFRSDVGEDLVLNRNVFVERVLPASILRKLDPDEMAAYRRPFHRPGEDRRPTLSWPRQIPIDGAPRNVADICEAYTHWLERSVDVPKLFVNAEPGILGLSQRARCRSFPNQTEVSVAGLHFLQEDSPKEIAEAIVRFCSHLRNKSSL